MDSNITTSMGNHSGANSNGDELKFGILKICLFSTFFVLGLIGNSLVLIGIGLNKGMQTPTNLLIFNLAVADVLFIIVCIPTTLVSFFGRWPFADIGCKLAQFINHLSAFMSIYLLVFMSIDRYLAVVHAVDSMGTYRTTKNTTICIITLWCIGVSVSMMIGSLFTVIKFGDDPSRTSMYCLLRYLQLDSDSSPLTTTTTTIANKTETELFSVTTFLLSNTTDNVTANVPAQTLPLAASLYWFGFVLFLYALPLTIVIILYGMMLQFLRGSRGQSVGKSKRRATRMILAVVLTYALCWFFMQLLFISNIILSRNTGHNFATYMDILTMLANVFAYLNSCTNPILYGFMSKNFRSSFIDLLCCRYSKRRRFMVNNNSSRSRRIIDNNKNVNSISRPNGTKTQPSAISQFSQLSPNVVTSNTGGDTGYSSCSHVTAELLSKCDPQETKNEADNVEPLDCLISCQITVGTQTNSSNKPHRRRKHVDRSPAVAYSSLPTKPTSKASAVLCT